MSRTISLRLRRALLAGALFVLSSPSAHAEVDLTLLRDGESYLKPTLQLDSALFYSKNAWFGESRQNAGDHVDFWGEFGVKPGLEGALDLGDPGTLRARVSGVWTTTQFGLDAAGSNFDDLHPNELTLEEAYIGWSSGNLFSSLGEDAIDLSAGAQKYQVGSGFLFWDGGTDGGSDRGGYWLGMRKAFELTAIARLKTGPFLGEVVYLRPNSDLSGADTDIVGVNLEWSFGERANLGAGYWYFANDDDFRREGLDVLDLRGDVHPLDQLPGLVLMGEVVYQRNSDVNESWAGYAELGHSFEETFAKPYVSYRFAGFTGDRGGPDQIEGYDPLFYGFSDWSTWYFGEIFGEYVALNRNLNVHTLRLRAQPHEDWTVNLTWLYFRLDELATELAPRLFDPRVVDIRDKDLGQELNLAVDWAMHEHFALSGMVGALFPDDGLKQGAGGSSVWTHFMLYASLSF